MMLIDLRRCGSEYVRDGRNGSQSVSSAGCTRNTEATRISGQDWVINIDCIVMTYLLPVQGSS